MFSMFDCPGSAAVLTKPGGDARIWPELIPPISGGWLPDTEVKLRQCASGFQGALTPDDVGFCGLTGLDWAGNERAAGGLGRVRRGV